MEKRCWDLNPAYVVTKYELARGTYTWPRDQSLGGSRLSFLYYRLAISEFAISILGTETVYGNNLQPCVHA